MKSQELREKQRREAQDNRRSFHQQEDEEMRRRREHDLSLRKESVSGRIFLADFIMILIWLARIWRQKFKYCIVII